MVFVLSDHYGSDARLKATGCSNKFFFKIVSFSFEAWMEKIELVDNEKHEFEKRDFIKKNKVFDADAD